MPETLAQADKHLVGDASSWRDGERCVSEIRGRQVGVFAIDGGFVAYENVCPHSGGPVCEGRVVPAVKAMITEDGMYHGEHSDDDEPHVVCPWHGWEFTLKTGQCIGDPERTLRSFPVVVEEGKVYVIV